MSDREFEITLIYRKERKFISVDTVKDKNLFSAVAQFLLILAKLHGDIVKEVKSESKWDDDIPF